MASATRYHMLQARIAVVSLASLEPAARADWPAGAQDWSAMQSHPVVVFVRGFLDVDWTCHRQLEATLRNAFPRGKLLVVDPSPVASLHDRVCQIFYELKGGRCFFGEAHSKFHGHSPYGDEYEGKLKDWDEYSPIHLVGHSFGGNTARVLVQYLADNFFPGHQTSARWVASITIVASPQRGAISCYALGMSMVQPPHIRWLSPGFMIGVLVHLTEYAGLTHVTKMAHWPQGWFTLVQALLGVSQVYAGTDNAAYDMTQLSQEHWREHLTMHPELYYFNVVCTKSWGRTMHTPLFVRCCHAIVYGMVRLQRGVFGPPIRGELVRALKSSSSDIPDGFDGILHAFEQVPEDESMQLVNPEDTPRLLQQGHWYTFMFPSDHVGVLRDEQFAQLVVSNIQQTIECPCSPSCAASRKKSAKQQHSRHPSQQMPPAPPTGAHGHTTWGAAFRLTLLAAYLSLMYIFSPLSIWTVLDGGVFVTCFCLARVLLPRSYWTDVAHLFKGLLVAWYLFADTEIAMFHRHMSVLLFVDIVMFCLMLSEVPWNSGLVGMACRSLFLSQAVNLLTSYKGLLHTLMVVDVSYLLLVLSRGLSLLRHAARSWWKFVFLAAWGSLVFCDGYHLLSSLRWSWAMVMEGAVLDALQVLLLGVMPTAFLSTLKMTSLSDHYQLIVRQADKWYASC